MKVIESDEFKKEFKKFSKKYRSFPKDFDFAKQVIVDNPDGKQSANYCKCISQSGSKSVYKSRMMVRDVRGAYFRLVYLVDKDVLELLFIEVYFKGDKVNEDQSRIKKYLCE